MAEEKKGKEVVSISEQSTNQNKISFIDLPKDVFLSILQKLDGASVKNVYQSCRLIGNNANLFYSNLKRFPIEKMICTVIDDELSISKCGRVEHRYNSNLNQSITIPKTDIAAFLHKYAPKELHYYGGEEMAVLADGWFNVIEKLVLCLSDNSLAFYLGALKKCSKVDIFYEGRCFASDIFNAMAAVERFKFIGSGIQMDENALLMLTRKIKKGGGVDRIEIRTFPADHWLEKTAFFNFLKDLEYSFATADTHIGRFQVRVTLEEADSILKEMNFAVYVVYRDSCTLYYGSYTIRVEWELMPDEE